MPPVPAVAAVAAVTASEPRINVVAAHATPSDFIIPLLKDVPSFSQGVAKTDTPCTTVTVSIRASPLRITTHPQQRELGLAAGPVPPMPWR